jgi:hypothetical protein
MTKLLIGMQVLTKMNKREISACRMEKISAKVVSNIVLKYEFVK